MAMVGEKSEWSPLETNLKLLNFAWVESPRTEILASLLPSRGDGQGTDEAQRPRLWACGSPGLVVASLDLSTGQLEQIALPDPMLPPRQILSGQQDGGNRARQRFKDGRSFMASLADTKAVSMVCAAGSQLWVGTERGTLHTFVVPSFSSHHAAQLRDAVLCLASGELVTAKEQSGIHDSSLQLHVRTTAAGGLQWMKNTDDVAGGAGDMSSTRYVLAGLANGQLVKFTLRNMSDPFQIDPEVISLGSSPVKALVIADGDVVWCGVGTEIVVLRVETMKEITRFDAQPDKAYSGHRRSLVSHLVHSPLGIWSTCWHTNFIQLWDAKTYSRRTSIMSHAHDEHAHLPPSSADVSAIAVTQGILIIGTEGGMLLLIDIAPSDSLTNGCTFRPKFLGGKPLGTGHVHGIVPIETNQLNPQTWSLKSDRVTSTDLPMRILTCCDTRFDARHLDSAPAGQAGKSLRNRFRSGRSADDEKDAKVEISCWQFHSSQDPDRHQRLRLYNQAQTASRTNPFTFPKLSLVRVCPTAVVATPLGE